MSRSPLRQVFILQSVAIAAVVVEILFLVCHVISEDHLIKGSCDFIGGSPSSYVATLSSLMPIGIVVVEI